MRFVMCGAGATDLPVYTTRRIARATRYHRRGEVEAESLNGEIVRLGRQYGVSTPYNSLLLELSTAMAVAREQPGTYTVRQLWERIQA